MKKVIIFSFIALTIQSCGLLKKNTVEHNHCSEELEALYSFWDTVDVEFIGVDSSLFKGKVYRKVALDMLVNSSLYYRQINIQNIKTGKIHRLVLDQKVWLINGHEIDIEEYPFDTTQYRFDGW